MRTLNQFPEAFYPMAVIVGDRREDRPKSPGDILAYSASPADLMYLPSLRLRDDVLIESDKPFAFATEQTLKSHFGRTNLLVIGSPASNFAARRVNPGSIFRFDITAEAQQDFGQLKSIIDIHPFDESWLQICLDVLRGLSIEQCLMQFERRRTVEPTPHKIREFYNQIHSAFRATGLSDLKSVLRKFVRPGLVDTRDSKVHGTSTSPDNDFGLVSIGINPFSDSDEFVSILVAGIHCPGTALGIKVLANPSSIENHPFGGIFEVSNLQRPGEWRGKFHGCSFRWETADYTPAELSRIIGTEVTQCDAREPDGVRQAERLYSFVSYLSRDRGASSNIVFLSMPLDNDGREKSEHLAKIIESTLRQHYVQIRCVHPYAADTKGQWNYVQGILAWFPSALLVVHDVTTCSAGVMFEIGCSFGFNRKPLLLIRKAKSSPTDIGERLPRLLRFVNALEVDLQCNEDRAQFTETLLATAMQPTSQTEPPISAPQKVFIMMNSRWSEQRKSAMQLVTRRELVPVVEEHGTGSTDLDRVRYGIEISTICIIDVSGVDPEHPDLDGLVALGIARALGKRVLQLVHASRGRPSSMFEGKSVRWNDGDFEPTLASALNELEASSHI